MIEQQDKKLVIRLREGDGVAFEKLFYKYHAKLFNFSFRLLRSKQEAENIVQQTFLKVWEYRENLDENSSFSGFLFKVSHNQVFNQFRSRLNHRYYLEYLMEYAETLENTVDRQIDYTELEAYVHKLLQQLPERRKEIFLLSREQGLSYKEIADKLDISENTVDTQIRKVLNYFRQALREKVLPIIPLITGLLFIN
jgi:RNA polymerase sigma-70 factor, ECF subfamily